MLNTTEFDKYIPADFRVYLEKTYYQKVEEQADIEELANNKSFYDDPTQHVGLYTDHGVIHARNVAAQAIHLADVANGRLIYKRSQNRLEFIKGLGVIYSFLHDVGMSNFSAFGRKMHPEFAAQIVFGKEFSQHISNIYEENYSNIAWRLTKLNLDYRYNVDVRFILRELLSLSICHSKSKIDISLINNLKALQKHITKVVTTPLTVLYEESYNKEVESEFVYTEPAYYDLHYTPYCWLTDENNDIRNLVDDVMDTLRILRSADALRQRGTVLKTSGGYEIFTGAHSANAIYALRNNDHSKLFLYEAAVPINAGEANIASSEIDDDSDLRISFHRGSYVSEEITMKAAYNTAVAVNDIIGDVVESFNRDYKKLTIKRTPDKKYADIKVLLENCDDNPNFSAFVKEKLLHINPTLEDRIMVVSSLQGADHDEINRFIGGKQYDWSMDKTIKLLKNLKQGGFKVNEIDLGNAFEDVMIIKVMAGELLIKANTKSKFVYIPLGKGLRVFPLGGYIDVPSPPFIPVGNTGVIRGARRNANVLAKKDLKLLMIPKKVYLDYWHKTYSTEELEDMLKIFVK